MLLLFDDRNDVFLAGFKFGPRRFRQIVEKHRTVSRAFMARIVVIATLEFDSDKLTLFRHGD